MFNNITGTPTEKLIKINTAFFRSAMVAMANRHSADLIYSKFSFIFDLKDDYHLEVLMAYTLSMINRSPKEIKETFMNLDLTIDKNRVMSTLEMILKEGEEVGIKKGEEIGIKKGEEKQRIFSSLINLLKVLDKFPNWKVSEISNFTEIKEEKIQLLLAKLPTKDLKSIQKTVNSVFFSNIKLNRSEKIKVSKLINIIIKKK